MGQGRVTKLKRDGSVVPRSYIYVEVDDDALAGR